MKLVDMIIKEVSLVDKPANGIKLLLVKRQDDNVTVVRAGANIESVVDVAEVAKEQKILADLKDCLKFVTGK